jgi:hypothetical protein
VRSPKRIALTFLEAQFGQLSISPLAEALLAPAVLPRGDLSMRLLQGVQDVRPMPVCGGAGVRGRRVAHRAACSAALATCLPAAGFLHVGGAGKEGCSGALRCSAAFTPGGRLPISAAALQFGIKVPFRSAQQLAAGRAVGASYLLTYLDGDMLIGRASSPSGTFIFQRAE